MTIGIIILLIVYCSYIILKKYKDIKKGNYCTGNCCGCRKGCRKK